MGSGQQVIPKPPEGFTLINEVPPPPAGFRLIEESGQPSAMDRAGRVAGLGARAVVKGLAGIPTLMADAASEVVNAGIYGARKLGLQTDYQMQKPSAVLDRNLTAAGLPEPENRTERVSSDITSAMAGQGAFLKLGNILKDAASPVMRSIGELFASNPGQQVASAVTGQTAASATREAGGGPVAQFAANLAGSIVPGVVAGSVKRGAPNPANRELLDTAEKYDVPLSYADVTGKGRKLETALEQVPVVGAAGFREKGAAKVTAAAEGVTQVGRKGMEAAKYEGMPELQAAASAGDKAAKQVLQDIQNAGEDWTKIMQASGNLKLWRARQAASGLYDEVERLANTRGEVPLNNTLQALDGAIAAEAASKLPDEAMLALLRKARNALTPKQGDGIDSMMMPNQAQNTGNNFSSLRALRSDLGEIIDGYYKGANAVVGGKGVGPLQSVKNAVEKDMEVFATQGGDDLAKAWRKADEFYRNAVVPYKDRALAAALKTDTPDEIYSKFIKMTRGGGGEDRAQKFYNALDEKGRAAVRYGMLANALDNAAIPGSSNISPAKFAKSMEDIAGASGVFFKGMEKSEIDGFVNLMRHAERFGQYAENPPTGQRVIPWLIGGAAAFSPTAVGVGMAATSVAKKLTMTKAGRDLLLEASALRPGTPEMQKLVDLMAVRVPQITEQDSQQSRQQESQVKPRIPAR